MDHKNAGGKMALKSKLNRPDETREIKQGERLVRTAINEFSKFDLLNSKKKNNRLYVSAKTALDTAEKIFDEKIKITSADDPMHDTVKLKKSMAIAVGMVVREYYREFLE
jgi:hypothetical protein